MRTNTRLATDPLAGLPPTVLGGEQRVRGVSLGAQGALTDKWDLTLSYTYMQSEILSVAPGVTLATLATVGKELPNTPNNSFSMWTSYDITDRLTVAGGATYNDKTFANANNTVYVPSYWNFDAMASYQVNKNFQLQLNVYNLTTSCITPSIMGVTPCRPPAAMAASPPAPRSEPRPAGCRLRHPPPLQTRAAVTSGGAGFPFGRRGLSP